ncbi:CDP-archaeol synthase [Hydrocarboniphaga effusa]|jgi:CDP-2,3-bis-(O-geranylgeranyl)-sn-glycerol synthase|uniref:CDP-archaeol synthase n=1 Tax=Hydrocarboniphaga effusa TaxID=243629 RepID=UPI003138399C
MQRLVELAYLMAPVYFANMAPPLVRFWPWWNPPIHRRALGDHKTVIGFVFGLIAAVATTATQHWLNWKASLLDYDAWLTLGVCSGAGALGGDCLKSFVKRRLGKKPGSRWVPADQLDFVIGGLLALSFWIRLSFADVLMVVSMSFVADLVVNRLAYRLGLRDTRW